MVRRTIIYDVNLIPFKKQAKILKMMIYLTMTVTFTMTQSILAALRSGLNCLGIAIAVLRIASKDCNRLFIRLLLSKR